MRNGGADEGAPGPRPHYGPGYFGAYLRDPDGNKTHLVYQREAIVNDAPIPGRSPAIGGGPWPPRAPHSA